MNYKLMGRVIALLLAVEAVFMLPPMALSFFDGEVVAGQSFLHSMAIIGCAVAILLLAGRHAPRGFYAKEGLVCVGLGWILLSMLGCLPFYLSREIPSYIDACFEMVSGFTTTGSSILTDVEAMSRGMLFWRSFSHWLGGMGVLVFALAVAPISGGNEGFTMHLLRAESPGPNVGKLVPRMRKTARILYLIYIVLTILNIVFLLAGGMPWFDSLCTAFGTAGTGGFGIKNSSMASYSPYLQNVTTVFMMLFGINFSCFYLILLKQFRDVFRDEELRLYLGIFFVATVLLVLDLRGFYGTLEEAVRHASFTTATIMTTTGYATTDFDLWPSFSKAIIVFLMVAGACAGSTGGGIKCSRIVLLAKTLWRNLLQAQNPQRIQVVRYNAQPVDERIVTNTSAYLIAYVGIILISYLVVSLDDFSSTTNFTAVLTCFNNVGPGLAQVGPVCNFSGYSDLSKLVLIADMLAGRLEILPILVLFSRHTWRRRG